MNPRDGVDRRIRAWLDETASASAPDYLGETLTRIEHLGQRPAWLSPWRWLPMQLTVERVRVPRLGPLLLVVGVLVATVLAAIVFAGSHRALPPPFGRATTGLLVYDSGGDLYTIAADGTTATDITADPAPEFGATWSRDGTRIAYWAGVPGSTLATLRVRDVTSGGDVALSADRSLSPDTATPAASWAPDGARLAFADRLGALYVVGSDGTGLTRLGDGPLQRYAPAWSPDGTLIAFQGVRGTDAGIYVIRPDGSGQTRVSAADAGASDFSTALPAWSPDGHLLAYHVGSTGGGTIAVATLAGGAWAERVLPVDGTSQVFPAWSNDGTRIAVIRGPASSLDGHLWTMTADGSNARQTSSLTVSRAPVCWTPDDRSILADEPGGLSKLLIPVDGRRIITEIPAAGQVSYLACSWQRLAP